MEVDAILSILIGAASSIVTSYIFWFLTFKLSLTKVEFSDKIAISKTRGPSAGKKRYIFRVHNRGRRDLTEVDFTIVCSIYQLEGGDHRRNNVYLSCTSHALPMLEGRRTQLADRLLHVRTMSILVPKETCADLASITKKPTIVEKGKEGTLTVGDLLEAFSGDDYLTIRIYAYGYDRVTGARKVFDSPLYTTAGIVEGEFVKLNTRAEHYLRHPRQLVADLGRLQPPAEPTAMQPPAEPTATEAPAEPTAAEPPAEPTATEPPAEPTATEAPAEPTATEPPAEPTATEAPAGGEGDREN